MKATNPKLVILTLTALAVIPGCGTGQASVTDAAEVRAATPVPVETAAPLRADIFATYHATSTIESDVDAPVLARVGGEVVELLVEEGDVVAAGQVLARLDGERLRRVFVRRDVGEQCLCVEVDGMAARRLDNGNSCADDPIGQVLRRPNAIPQIVLVDDLLQTLSERLEVVGAHDADVIDAASPGDGFEVELEFANHLWVFMGDTIPLELWLNGHPDWGYVICDAWYECPISEVVTATLIIDPATPICPSKGRFSVSAIVSAPAGTGSGRPVDSAESSIWV